MLKREGRDMGVQGPQGLEGSRSHRNDFLDTTGLPVTTNQPLFSFADLELSHPAGCEGFPAGSDSKESTCNAGDLGSSPGLGRSPGERKGYTLQYSSLENSKDCIVHRIAKSWT